MFCRPEHPEYHAPSDDDIQVEDQPYDDDASPTAESPGYIVDSDSMEEDDDEDPEEDPSEKHEPEDDDDDDDTEDKDEEPTEEEEEEEHLAPADSSLVHVVNPVPSAGDTEAFETDDLAPTPRSSQQSPAYDQAPLGHRASMIRMRDDIPEEDQPPRGEYYIIAYPPTVGCDVAKFQLLLKPEYVGYVRALQAFERRMMTSMEEVNLRVSYQAQVRRQESEIFYTQLHDAQTDRRDIRLEIDVVRGQRTAYETELHEWQRQRARNDAVRHIMRTPCAKRLELRIESTLETTDKHRGLILIDRKDRIISHISCCAIENQVKLLPGTLLGAALTRLGNDLWDFSKKKMKDKYCPKVNFQEA
ncbi:hypothetical protein Tco_0874243 [Tanacetum coccineum]|uniref:Uncharacterized protein n=1 Tax=Tanacetum coccineum TaxID=301880 RepID=A0ABQ5BP13_9ASTR